MNTLKTCRKRAGYTQVQLAEILHVHQTAISQWESGRTEPDLVNLQNLSTLYGVTIDYLLGRTNTDKNEKPAAHSDGQLEEKVDQALVDVLMSLSPEDRKMMLDLAERLKTAREEKPSL